MPAIYSTMGASPQAENMGAKAWVVVFTAALFFFYEFIQMTMFNSINVQLRADLGINATQISQLSSMYFDANVLFLIPAGLLLDRFSTRWLIILAMSTCIASNFIFASAHSFVVLEICRFVTGMGSTFCLLSCVHLASRWFPATRLALVGGLVVTMAMLGGTIGQTPFYLLSEHIGWRGAMVVSAFFGLAFLSLIFFFVVDCPEHFKEQHQAAHKELNEQGLFSSMISSLKNFQNWAAGLYTNFLSLPIILLGALWLDPYLKTVRGLEQPGQAANVAMMVFFGTIVGSPAMGWISDRLARRKMPMIVGGVLSLLNILVIMFSPTLSYHELLFLFFTLAFFASSQVISYALVPESNSRVVTATALSVMATLVMSAGAIFQPLFGYLMDASGLRDASGAYPAAAYTHAMMIFPVTFVAALILACCLKETYGRYRE